MVLLILLPLTALGAAISHATIIRLDRKSVWSHEYTEKKIPTISALKNTWWSELYANTPLKLELKGKDAFIVNLECSKVSETECFKIQVGLENAGALLAETLSITTPITIKAKYYHFCDGITSCDRADKLGGATYGSSFKAMKNGQYVTYGQGLLKQLNVDQTLVYSDADILAEFNAGGLWYFRDGSNKIIRPTQYDFQYVAMHELSHGLGFGTGLLEYSSVLPSLNLGSNFLAPAFVGGYEENLTTETKVSYISPIDVFDLYISSKEDKFSKLGKRVASFKTKGTRLLSFLGLFKKSNQFDAAKDLYESSTKGPLTLNFNAIDGSSMSLYSPQNYQQGSSISHVALSKKNSSDFLMIPSLSAGITYENIMRQTNSTSVYGPGTLSIMRTLGWGSSDTVVIAIDYKGEEGSGLSRKLNYLLLASVLVLMF